MKTKLSQKEINGLDLDGIIGSEIHFFPELTSTFDKIREYPPHNGLTVVCARQTAGCGRLGRRWESSDGGVYFTFMLTPPFNGFDIPFITIVCALGVQRALNKYLPCGIKWPNDIVYSGKKLCGILTRNLASHGKVDAVLVGIGINVNNSIFSKNLSHAASLSSVTYKEYNENLILTEVLNSIDDIYQNMSCDEILRLYKEVCVNLFREVTLVINGEELRGICTDILRDGSMNANIGDRIINVHSGEVSVKGIYEN